MSLSDKEILNNENNVSVDNENDDDDVPRLSVEALRALQEFYAESEENNGKIEEDWQLSQFWYDKPTSETLTKEALTLALENLERPFNIACISCPTLFKTLNHYLKDLKHHPDLKDLNEENSNRIDIKLFEYDKRFEIYAGDFVFYDYKNPIDLDEKYFKHFDLIISDPPFLSDECHIKTAMTVRKIGKDDLKLIICTGAIMEDLLAASLKVKLCSFVPRHERNLANAFKCYSNYTTHFLDN